MATCTRKEIPPVKPKFAYTLKLDQDEVETLSAILGVVGGDPTLSSRKYTDRLWKALHQAGVPDGYSLKKKGQRIQDGQIFFTDRIS